MAGGPNRPGLLEESGEGAAGGGGGRQGEAEEGHQVEVYIGEYPVRDLETKNTCSLTRA